MSAATSSYSSLLDDMWAPEGSDMSERLKRLQDLEKMRKEREAKRQAMFNKNGGETKFGITTSTRIRSTNADDAGPTSTGTGIRRTWSLNEESGYGGARPKLGTYKKDPIMATTDVENMFGDIKAQILGSRKPMWSDTSRQTDSRSRIGSSDSEDSYIGSNSTRPKYDFSKSYTSTNPYSFTSGSDYSSRRPYTSRYNSDHETNGQNGDSGDYNAEHIDGTETNEQTEVEEHNDTIEDDEEPKHFIERLKQGNHDNNFSVSQNSAFLVHSIPELPPFRPTDNSKPADLPELVRPTDDIMSVAQEISATFGGTSPGLTPSKTPGKTRQSNGKLSRKSSSKRKSSKKMAPEVPPKPVTTYETVIVDNDVTASLDDSVTYEIIEAEDSSGDERGKELPVRESFYHSRPSEWGVIATTPGKIDVMHEFFNGDDIGGDPTISGELDGESLKAQFEQSFSEVSPKKPSPQKTPKSDRPKTPTSSRPKTPTSNRPKTPTSVQPKTPVSDKSKTPVSSKKSDVKEKVNGRRSKSPLDRLKNSVARTSESENESINTSGSDSDAKTKRNKKGLTLGSNSKSDEKKELSIDDKLAKLQSMTQEKKRKHSIGENDNMRPVPSYMSGTSASNQKRSKNKGATTPSAATHTHDLKKDVRELKQYVRQHSVPSTPVDSPVKSFSEYFGTPTRQVKVPTKEISVQTEFVIDFPDINYVCKHCGKSSFEEVVPAPLTVENLNKSQKRVNGKKETKTFSSKDSVKSLGDNSTKSERTTRYIKKQPTTTSSHSYMKGTTSSRLKNSGPPTEGEIRGRKGSAPELIHKMETESSSGVKSSSLRGTVSQKTKAFENKLISRATSSDRKTNNKTSAADKSRLRKSKSVDHVSAAMQEMSLSHDGGDELETTLTNSETPSESSPKSNTEPDAIKDGSSHLETVSSPPVSNEKVGSPQPLTPHVEVGKLDLSSLETPQSPSLRKPPVASPRIKSETHDIDEVAVESKGQFTSIGDNPFIKKDGSSRTRTRSRDHDETVWEKAEVRSRESSLKRSNSSSTGERPNSASPLRRHNTSAGEKSSVSELTWSDSGSTESLSKGSKSSHHGSNSSLNKDGIERSVRPRPRTTSTSSSTSCNSMLNLLSPSGSTRHPVSGAIETDVDAAYNEHIKEMTPDGKQTDHDEASVNRAHLEFAKNACNLLEFEMKKRDLSNDSDKGTKNTSDNKENSAVTVNGNHSNHTDTVSDTKPSKKDKAKKGLFKGKLFKK